MFCCCGTDIESLTEVDGVGRNCVMYAVHYSQLDTLQILLENGADVNLQSHGLAMILCVLILLGSTC